MNKITVVGLGPGDKNYLTVESIDTLKSGKKIFIRTEQHPVNKYLKDIGIKYETFDYFYEQEETFDSVYEKIVEELINQAKNEDIIYAVPGNPFVAERTVELLKDKYKNIEFIYGVSFIDAVLTFLKLDPINGLCIIDGLNIKSISNIQHNIIIQVYNNLVASDVKYKLSGIYGDDQEIYIIKSAGIKDKEKMIKVKLSDLDSYEDYDHLTSLYIKPVKEERRRKEFSDLVELMKVLRGENGCPWDRIQTHESIKKGLIEEAYEVVDAIENNDTDLLEEELGDLLLQIIFHSLIEEEMGYFDIKDVTNSIYEKLIRRHPHVFDNLNVNSAEEVEDIWIESKQNEKDLEYFERMEGVSKYFPALIRAYKVQNIAKEVGFDWDDIKPAIEKVKEETREMELEINNNNLENFEEELGDLLFSIVNISRYFNVCPEVSLTKSIKKFIERFTYIEKSNIARHKGLKNMSLNEMDILWEKSKK